MKNRWHRLSNSDDDDAITNTLFFPLPGHFLSRASRRYTPIKRALCALLPRGRAVPEHAVINLQTR